mmetsp:Transcript_31833/g.52467  ORF Transcript_31833/g.52467 Transcript_31833/m.52467 type:complete len:205 (+) Transcript_31833:2000-2614(+)
MGSRTNFCRAHFSGNILEGDEEGIGRNKVPCILEGGCPWNNILVRELICGTILRCDASKFNHRWIRSHNFAKGFVQQFVLSNLLQGLLNGRMCVDVDSEGIAMIVLNHVPPLLLLVGIDDVLSSLLGGGIRDKLGVDGGTVFQNVIHAVVRIHALGDQQIGSIIGRNVFSRTLTVIICELLGLTFLVPFHQLHLRKIVLNGNFV